MSEISGHEENVLKLIQIVKESCIVYWACASAVENGTQITRRLFVKLVMSSSIDLWVYLNAKVRLFSFFNLRNAMKQGRGTKIQYGLGGVKRRCRSWELLCGSSGGHVSQANLFSAAPLPSIPWLRLPFETLIIVLKGHGA